jgi:hypothetical protein
MTQQEANKLLDMRRDGMDMPQDVVTEALALTDDLSMVEPPSPSLERYVQALREKGVL